VTLLPLESAFYAIVITSCLLYFVRVVNGDVEQVYHKSVFIARECHIQVALMRSGVTRKALLRVMMAAEQTTIHRSAVCSLPQPPPLARGSPLPSIHCPRDSRAFLTRHVRRALGFVRDTTPHQTIIQRLFARLDLAQLPQRSRTASTLAPSAKSARAGAKLWRATAKPSAGGGATAPRRPIRSTP